jgi:hypothetical protein
MVKVAFHDGCKLDFEGLDASDGRDTFLTTETVDVEFAVVNVGDVIVFKEENSLGVLDDSRGIGREEEFDWDRHSVLGEECSRL